MHRHMWYMKPCPRALRDGGPFRSPGSAVGPDLVERNDRDGARAVTGEGT